MANSSIKQVLIITPSLSGLGGVANYYKTIFPLLFSDEYNIQYLEIGSTKKSGNLLYPVRDQFRLHNVIKKNNFDLVHINPSLNFKSFFRDALFIFQVKRKKIPVIVFFHGWDKNFAQRAEKNLKKIFQITYSKVNAFIVLASEFKNKLQTWGINAPIYLESTAVDSNLLNGFDIENKIYLFTNKQNCFRILFLARIERAKGIFETIDAIKLLRERGYSVTLTIAGDGPAKQEVHAYVDKLTLSPGIIDFIGYVRNQEKAKVFQKHDLYCFPTYYGEGMPTSVLEALAFGLPVITCKVGGLADIFQDSQMGSFVPKQDPQAIADKIEELISDNQNLAKISRFNHTYAMQNLIAPKVAQRLLSIYDKTLEFRI